VIFGSKHFDAADHLARPRKVRGFPRAFIGIHFFSPVERMMLVEIILGKETGDAALGDRASIFVRAIKKTPIVVQRPPAASTTLARGSATYIREGHLMFRRGACRRR